LAIAASLGMGHTGATRAILDRAGGDPPLEFVACPDPRLMPAMSPASRSRSTCQLAVETLGIGFLTPRVVTSKHAPVCSTGPALSLGDARTGLGMVRPLHPGERPVALPAAQRFLADR
jgi:hypothetical protein